MSDPQTVNQLVTDAYERSVALSNSVETHLASFTSALSSTLAAPPTINYEWITPAAPSLPQVPDAPNSPQLSLSVPATPAPLNEQLPEVVFDDIAQLQPPSLTTGAPPVLNFGVVPAIPQVQDIAIPDAPMVSLPDAPQFLTLHTPTFAGVNLREDLVERLNDTPELVIIQPQPLTYTRPAQYESRVLDGLKALIVQRLAGGTGLPVQIEQAIWGRARERELLASLAEEEDVTRKSEALGFALPPGVLADQIRVIRLDRLAKQAGLSRDIAIKQAEMEVDNLRATITAGMQLEDQLMQHWVRSEQLVFEAAKAAADNAIALHNAHLENFRALSSQYANLQQAYKTIIEAEMAKVEIYKAQLQAEQNKAQINTALVQQFKTQVEASMAHVELYRAQLGGAQTLMQLEQAKIGAASERVRAFTATMNAEIAKVEGYKAQVSADTNRVEAFKATMQAVSTKITAQAEIARARAARLTALAQAKTGEWDGYRAQVQGASAVAEMTARQFSLQNDAYSTRLRGVIAQAEMANTQWQGSMRQYEAAQTLALQTARANNDAIAANNQLRSDQSKVGAQTYAQLISSSFNVVNTSASMSSSGAYSWNYSGSAPDIT